VEVHGFVGVLQGDMMRIAFEEGSRKFLDRGRRYKVI
jgi:hypothetical protein